jgi:hypothetical protein
MKNLIIEEGHSIDVIKLGMTKEDVERYVQLSKNDSIEGHFYEDVQCEYDADGKVSHIHISNSLKDYYYCLFRGIDVFNTKAGKLVEILDKISPFDRNDDASLGYSYTFPQLGLSLWRGNVLNDEDLEADWFKELKPSIQEDEMKNLYFETVSIYSISNSPKE